jgi:hypothetical protein
VLELSAVATDGAIRPTYRGSADGETCCLCSIRAQEQDGDAVTGPLGDWAGGTPPLSHVELLRPAACVSSPHAECQVNSTLPPVAGHRWV